MTRCFPAYVSYHGGWLGFPIWKEVLQVSIWRPHVRCEYLTTSCPTSTVRWLDKDSAPVSVHKTWHLWCHLSGPCTKLLRVGQWWCRTVPRLQNEQKGMPLVVCSFWEVEGHYPSTSCGILVFAFPPFFHFGEWDFGKRWKPALWKLHQTCSSFLLYDSVAVELLSVFLYVACVLDCLVDWATMFMFSSHGISFGSDLQPFFVAIHFRLELNGPISCFSDIQVFLCLKRHGPFGLFPFHSVKFIVTSDDRTTPKLCDLCVGEIPSGNFRETTNIVESWIYPAHTITVTTRIITFLKPSLVELP